MAIAAQLRTLIRRLLRQLARPVRRDQGGEGLVVEPYRGYGNGREIYFMGRVFRQSDAGGGAGEGDLRVSLRRLLRRGAAGRTLTARYGGSEQRVTTDRRGYFTVHLQLPHGLTSDEAWQQVSLRLDLPSGRVARASAAVFVAPPAARFVVISDIDDTVMFTGVAQKLRMLWRLFARDAQSRVAFPGVASFYRALHGPERNPMLYVSRSPWSIYSMLEAFFRHHDIPVGPVLFLRDWGMSVTRPLPRRGAGHKLALIRDMLALYRDLPFVLIGDSGQHDPETYARVVHEHPGRVAGIYIRNVSRTPDRVQAIEALAEEVLQAGSSLLLAADSVAMAEHAAARGLIPQAAVQAVASERAEAGGRAAQPEQADDAPPTVVVESEHQDSR